jgi:CubicO group peptidase (beta-lactamase class C family)
MRTQRAALLVTLIGTAVELLAGAQPAELDAYIEAERAQQRIPGLSIAVLRNGALDYAKGYGFANLEHETPATERTVYQSGSIGKQFTAALVMSLVEDGRLALDESLSSHVPNAPDAWRGITVRHLLTHTAGLSDAIYDAIDPRKDYTEAELVREIAALPLDFAPGDRWSYSNSGYVLLGTLIRDITGQFHGDALRARVLEPAGMSTARIIGEADIVPNRAAGYRLVDGEIKNQEWVSPTLNTTADGSLYLSVLDLAKWDAALTNATVLSKASLEASWTPARLNDGSAAPYGFGWELGELAGHRVVQHGGRWQGFTTHIARYLDDGLTVIVLTNLRSGDPGEIARGIAGMYERALAPR